MRMKTPRKGIRLLDTGDGGLRDFKSAVSLHCHTDQSREVLDFVPYYASKIPLVSHFLERELQSYTARNGEVIDFARAFWTPPLPARAVLEGEIQQIEGDLGLKSLVSITDHDDIRACTRLQVLHPELEIPLSLEWTVPFGCGFFHLGVHNLQPATSAEIWAQLNGYTRNSRDGQLQDLFELLCSHESTLLVLNHPLWDIERIGEAGHLHLLTEFLAANGRWIHAIEVKGYRSWSENKAAIKLADDYGYPIISGGDRHGTEANSILNLTTAASFSEFAAEIRFDRVTELAILPSYKEPTVPRMLETVADVLKYYPGHPAGRRFWTDRIFWTLEDGTIRPMSFYWKRGGPAWVRASLAVMKIIGSRQARPAMRLVFAREEGVWL
jgi:hypothetical protein